MLILWMRNVILMQSVQMTRGLLLLVPILLLHEHHAGTRLLLLLASENLNKYQTI